MKYLRSFLLGSVFGLGAVAPDLLVMNVSSDPCDRRGGRYEEPFQNPADRIETWTPNARDGFFYGPDETRSRGRR